MKRIDKILNSLSSIIKNIKIKCSSSCCTCNSSCNEKPVVEC